ncbi:hypothetical protein EUGRSUZ_L03565 [Eucalyptus grandis]|uniref:Endoplasmic reticulum transmembrane protein n=1 Tax=Eucalyptus grandis TaxID=71139 RepID=A0AAD9WHP5_EUCGR|nr:hypothetical protein EUGRSUZ_L03565 [Eucalyptus grandis]
MALQWMILTYVVAAEAAVAFLLTLPSPKFLKNHLVSFVSLVLQPALFVVPFAGFQLLDIYWKSEHRLSCTSDICTAAERDRYEKAVSRIDLLPAPVLKVSEVRFRVRSGGFWPPLFFSP